MTQHPSVHGFPKPAPAHTRRQSIPAIVSCAAFVILALAGVRSFWTWDRWNINNGRAIGISSGCIFYTRGPLYPPDFAHLSGNQFATHSEDRISPVKWRYLGFSIRHQTSISSPRSPNQKFQMFFLRVPIWFPLLLLLIVPVRWLFMRLTSVAAFPVIFDVKRG